MRPMAAAAGARGPAAPAISTGNSSGAVAYSYSDDHEFVQTVGTSMVNLDDKLVYTETVDFDDLSQPLAPGTYTVQTVLANYPEMHAQTQVTVQP